MIKPATIQFSSLENGEIKIVKGSAPTFIPLQTVVIKEDGLSLWDVINGMVGLPYPIYKNKPVVQAPSNPIVTPKLEKRSPSKEPLKNNLEAKLSEMSGSAIIDKVYSDKGVKILISPKSKKSVIKRALQIYNGGGGSFL